MLTTNMAIERSDHEKARKLEKHEEREKKRKVYEYVTMLRVTEFAVGGLTSVGMGALKAYKPEFEDAFYGLAIDGTVTLVGGTFFFLAGDKKSGDYMREIGGGMIGAGGYSLGQKAGKKLVEYATAP